MVTYAQLINLVEKRIAARAAADAAAAVHSSAAADLAAADAAARQAAEESAAADERYIAALQFEDKVTPELIESLYQEREAAFSRGESAYAAAAACFRTMAADERAAAAAEDAFAAAVAEERAAVELYAAALMSDAARSYESLGTYVNATAALIGAYHIATVHIMNHIGAVKNAASAALSGNLMQALELAAVADEQESHMQAAADDIERARELRAAAHDADDLPQFENENHLELSSSAAADIARAMHRITSAADIRIAEDAVEKLAHAADNAVYADVSRRMALIHLELAAAESLHIAAVAYCAAHNHNFAALTDEEE